MPTHRAWTEAKKRLKDHQSREAQDVMFSEVLTRLDKGERVVPAEGHTGVGKSLIVAAVAASQPVVRRRVVRDGERFWDRARSDWVEPGESYEVKPRVVISAYTKAQQRTIYDETFPRASGLLPRGYAVLYGRSNYVCLDRAALAGIDVEIVGDGTRAHYPGLSNDQWDLVRSSGDDGCDNKCYEDAYRSAKETAREVSALMVNHSLLALNHQLEGLVFGELSDDALIVDEAHLLPNALRSAYGVDLSPLRFRYVASALAKAGFNPDTIDLAGTHFAKKLSEYRAEGQSWKSQVTASYCRELMRVEYELIRANVDRGSPREHKAALRRFSNLWEALRMLAADRSDYAAWVHLSGRAKVEAQPFEIHKTANEIFRSAERTVVMSATMEPLGTKLLGLDMPVTYSPQPFDLATRRLGYVSTIPIANNEPHQWSEEELVGLVRTANVGTMVIASSNAQKDRAAAALEVALS